MSIGWHSTIGSIATRLGKENQFCRLESFHVPFEHSFELQQQQRKLLHRPLHVNKQQTTMKQRKFLTCLAWKFIKITQVELNSNWRQIIGKAFYVFFAFRIEKNLPPICLGVKVDFQSRPWMNEEIKKKVFHAEIRNWIISRAAESLKTQSNWNRSAQNFNMPCLRYITQC